MIGPGRRRKPATWVHRCGCDAIIPAFTRRSRTGSLREPVAFGTGGPPLVVAKTPFRVLGVATRDSHSANRAAFHVII